MEDCIRGGLTGVIGHRLEGEPSDKWEIPWVKSDGTIVQLGVPEEH